MSYKTSPVSWGQFVKKKDSGHLFLQHPIILPNKEIENIDLLLPKANLLLLTVLTFSFSCTLLILCSCTSIFHNRNLPCPSQVPKHCLQPMLSSFPSCLYTYCSLYEGNPSLAPTPLAVSYLLFGNSNGIPLGDLLHSSTESSTSTSILSSP